MKEKIGIEKLIELLNEYRKIDYVPEKMKNVLGVNEEKIISKKFGFIKWLVENDKIDRDKVDDKFERPFYGYTNYEIVLMLLSISDTPIEDLISYLK